MKLKKYKPRNPKKIGIIIFTITCILLITGIFLYTSFASFETRENFNIINGNVQEQGDLYFAFYINGNISKTMPKKGEGYIFDQEKTTCTNGASVEFDTIEWAVKVVNMTTAKTKCNLYFKTETFSDSLITCSQNNSAANCFIENSNKNSEQLAFDNTTDNNLRYIGANPNNYVSFNNELWRIIGSMNNIDDGTGTKETRLKIIQNNFYGVDKQFDSAGTKNWSEASLQVELNNTFLSNISNDYQLMIENALWNLGGSDTFDNLTVNDFYQKERGNLTYNNLPAKWVGMVGLIYPSDYGFATNGGSNKTRENCLKDYLYNWNLAENNDCKNNDWLYNNITNLLSITQVSTRTEHVFRICINGAINYDDVRDNDNGSKAVLYLKSNVKIISGDGSDTNPYQLSL